MLYAYLVSSIVGGLLLVASVLGGHHGDTHGGDAGGHGHGGHDADHSHGSASVATMLFSVRTWTYLLAFGGATGLLLTLVAGAGPVLTGVLAGGVGLTAGGVAHAVIGRMSSQVGGTVQDDELVGKTGQLLLPVGKDQSGTVRLTVKNATVDLIATTDEPTVLPAREEVIVVEMKEGTAVVARSPLGARKQTQ